MENYIFSPRKSTSDELSNTEPVYFTLYGQHDFIDDNGNPRANIDNKSILAKTSISENNNQSYYFLKVGAHGRIFNPMGLYSEGKQLKFMSKIGKNEFEFKKVNKKVFDLYLNFLRTKNIAWLNNAEREMS
jgi:hypothetical protein